MATHILFLRPPVFLGDFIRYVERDMGYLEEVVVGDRIKEYATMEDQIADRTLPETDFEKNKHEFNYCLDQIRGHVRAFKADFEEGFSEWFAEALMPSFSKSKKSKKPKEEVIKIPEEKKPPKDKTLEEVDGKLREFGKKFGLGDIDALMEGTEKYGKRRRQLVKLGYSDQKIQTWYDKIDKIGSLYGYHLVEISVPTFGDIFQAHAPNFTYFTEFEAMSKILGIDGKGSYQIMEMTWVIAHQLEKGKEVKDFHSLLKKKATKKMSEMGIPIWSEHIHDESERTIIHNMKVFETTPLPLRLLSKLLEELHGRPTDVLEILNNRQLYSTREWTRKRMKEFEKEHGYPEGTFGDIDYDDDF